MINFVSTSPNNLIKYGGGSPYIGYLGTPRTLHNIPDSMTFALDNDCFNDYNPDKIITMLKKYTSIANRCKFATVPDVVENAVKTTVLFDWWFHVYKRYGYTCAYVLQDGVTTNMIPYNRIGALFIGGSTEFKLSKYTAGIVKDAVDKGLWVHMGRVNSAARASKAQDIGCHSTDGTQYSRYPRTYIKKFLPYYENRQINFLELVS